MPTYNTPGVYIQELPATGPISGVGTSTAAFIGPAMKGPLNVPTPISNWTQFKGTFGDYIPVPRIFLPHAVEGFFKNGGTFAYVVRIGTAKIAFLDLNDGNKIAPVKPTLHVEALTEGVAGNSLSVQVQDAHIVTAATPSRGEANIDAAKTNNNVVTLAPGADPTQFRPGDILTVGGIAGLSTIDRIQGNQILLLSKLGAGAPVSPVRIADLAPAQTTFRVDNIDGLEVGSVIEISQTVTPVGGAPATTTTENAVVSNVSAGFVTLSTGLANTYTMAKTDPAVTITSFEFNLIIYPPDALNLQSETFSSLSMDPRHSHYFTKVVNSAYVNVRLFDPPSAAVPPDNRPAVLAKTTLLGGIDDDKNAIQSNDFTAGIDTLTPIQDVNLLCIPDRTDATVQQAAIAHCETMGNRFAILDSSRSAPPFGGVGTGSVSEQRAGLDSARGYAALYYPWLSIPDPQSSTGDMLLVPPSGFMAGIYARVDQQRGVHKAPANEMVTGAQGLEDIFDVTTMGQLNIAGINLIRTFPNSTRPTVWGARTTTPAAEVPWRYTPVRRLFIYIEESIKTSIRWAVFEPNDLALWEKLKRTIREFLTRVWRGGALFGATADQAFYVKCDEELNPASVRALGQLFVEIGIAPVRPAEFVIIQIGLWDDGSQVSES